MFQVRWHIWGKRRLFPSLAAMVAFAGDVVERAEHRWGPPGSVTLVAYDALPDGRYRLRSIADWQANLVPQVQTDAQHIERLDDLIERFGQ